MKATTATVRKELADLRKRCGWGAADLANLLRQGGTARGKGQNYERELCKELSLWWTGGARDDVFWRSAGSGARAKVRGRAGRDTAGQHGDIATTDPIGAPLIDVFTIEIKRGYTDSTAYDLLDRPVGGGVQVWEQFFAQTIESHELAGSLAWMLIVRRDRRKPLVWVPSFILPELARVGAFPTGYPLGRARVRVAIRDTGKRLRTVDASCMSLNDWLAEVDPKHVKALET